MSEERQIIDHTTNYARAVVSGEIVAGWLVRAACQRHLDDLENGPARGLAWDVEAADRVFRFFAHLRLPADGELEGKPFELEPFQKFIIGSLFGWKMGKHRRFRTAYVEQGKGNGKSPLAGGVGLYGLVADGEAGSEVYAAATTREQAGILFRDAKRMAEASPSLSSRLRIVQNNISYERTDSYFRPVSAEHRGLDGKRPHMALIDEVHEHPTPMVVDKMRAGTKSRRNALIFQITNSGVDRTSVCWHQREFSVKVLTGVVQNDSWFAYVCTLDPCAKCRAEGSEQPVEGCPDCDDWRDEGTWVKANPGLETILPIRYLREQVEEAKGIPAKEGIVRRLNFCAWTSVATRAIPMDRWDYCGRCHPVAQQVGPGKPLPLRKRMAEALARRECYGGLDIGSTSDFTAFVLAFPHDDGDPVEVKDPGRIIDGEPATRAMVRRTYSLLSWFWLPESPARRDEKMTAQIDVWRRLGLIRTTPGDVVDYDLVLQDILELSKLFSVQIIAIDRGFQGAQMATNLMKEFGDDVVKSFAQGIVSMSAPFREMVELLKQGRLHHDANPVLRWMASNTAAEERGGLIKPSKDHSTEKIDGITAATMALGVAITHAGVDNWYKPGMLSS